MAEGRVHVVGAGLAGLSAALHLAARGLAVTLWEAAGHAGGRCRSFQDAVLDRLIDNGNHLVLSGNSSVLAYLDLAGAPDALVAAPEAAFPFVDLASGERWTVRLNRGRLPLWAFDPVRRIPGTRALEYLGGLRLALAGSKATVADTIPARGPIWTRFWEPLTLGVLNAPPEQAQARLLWRVFRETLAKGEAYSRPMFAPAGLGAAVVDPAVRRLADLGAEVRFGCRVRALETMEGRAAALVFEGERLELGANDRVVLAVPPARLGELMPGLALPGDGAPILNAHFVVPERSRLAKAPPMLGVLGGLAQWIFVRGDVASVTVSAASAAGGADRERLLAELWEEVSAALCLGAVHPVAGRLIIEKRATFDQSPEGVARRPAPRTHLANVVLAGDATDTGLPATIEGAVRSGAIAAGLLAQ